MKSKIVEAYSTLGSVENRIQFLNELIDAIKEIASMEIDAHATVAKLVPVSPEIHGRWGLFGSHNEPGHN